MSTNIPSLKELMEAGVHFGHVAKYWNPKTADFIYTKRDRVHVLDLEKTHKALTEILPKITAYVAQGKVILLVGTKKQIRSIITEVGPATGMPYIDLRWLGGTLTNFKVMQLSIKRMKEILEFLNSEKSSRIIKKERLNLQRQYDRMHEKFGGLLNLNKLPDAVFIIDPHYERNAIHEAKVLGLEIFAILDTNSDPSEVDYVIPANDDAKKSVALIMNSVKEAILDGQKQIKVSVSPQVNVEIKDEAEQDKKSAE